MTIRLGTNIDSLAAQRELSQSTSALATSYERLASGLRINSASDDPAGAAVAAQLTSQSRVSTQAIRNVNDGVSAANIAAGALSSLQQISQRQLELAEEAANGSYSLAQRQALNAEAGALGDEYNRIVNTTTFNGLSLFDPSLGTVLIQAGYGKAGELQLNLSDQLKRAVGDGTFQAAKIYTSGGNSPTSVILVDLNGDGKLDLVTSDSSGADVSSMLGNGDGTFQAAKTFHVGGASTNFVTAGDINHDGKVDLVASDASGDVSIFIGNGDGNFQAVKTIALAGAAPAVTLGDVNGDGNLDIVVTGQISAKVAVLLNNGDGTFKSSTAANNFATAGTSPQGVILADLNGDGTLDIATADSGSNDISVLIGNGDGMYAAVKSYHVGGASPLALTALDLNNDGILDLVSADISTSDISVLIGNGNGTFQAAKTYASNGATEEVTSGDINGDGNPDIITAGAGGGVGVYLSNGDGTFQAIQSTTSAGGGGGHQVGVGDVDGDGRLDVVAANNGNNDVAVLLSNGPYTSTAARLNIATQQRARSALDTVNVNLSRIDAQLGVIGAATEIFQTQINFLQTANENFEAAAGRIQDADVASESANLARTQILQQAAASVLAHANQEPQLALKLLA